MNAVSQNLPVKIGLKIKSQLQKWVYLSTTKLVSRLPKKK